MHSPPKLLVRLAEIGIYGFSNAWSQKIRIILMGTTPTKILTHLSTTHPSIVELATIELLVTATFDEKQYQNAIMLTAAIIVYVCAVQTGEKLLMLQRFIYHQESVPGIVCETDNQRAFEWLKSAISHYENVFENRLDQIAIVIHNSYVKHRLAESDSAEQNPSLVEWNDLPEGLKNANRHQADHIAIKCHYLTGRPAATRTR
jgi:hypothetical protein